MQKPIIQVLYPIKRGDDIRFVLAIAMNPQTLNDIFVEQQPAKTWTGAIVDTQQFARRQSYR